MPTRARTHRPAGSGDHRPNAQARGYSWSWQKASKAYLRAHPLCVECKSRGVLVAARLVDHIIPHRGNADLFWRETNWQSLCHRCHNAKTRRGE